MENNQIYAHDLYVLRTDRDGGMSGYQSPMRKGRNSNRLFATQRDYKRFLFAECGIEKTDGIAIEWLKKPLNT